MHHAVSKEGCYSNHSHHGDCCQGDNYCLFVAQCARVYKGGGDWGGESKNKSTNQTLTFMMEEQMSETMHWHLICKQDTEEAQCIEAVMCRRLSVTLVFI